MKKLVLKTLLMSTICVLYTNYANSTQSSIGDEIILTKEDGTLTLNKLINDSIEEEYVRIKPSTSLDSVHFNKKSLARAKGLNSSTKNLKALIHPLDSVFSAFNTMESSLKKSQKLSSPVETSIFFKSDGKVQWLAVNEMANTFEVEVSKKCGDTFTLSDFAENVVGISSGAISAALVSTSKKLNSPLVNNFVLAPSEELFSKSLITKEKTKSFAGMLMQSAITPKPKQHSESYDKQLKLLQYDKFTNGPELQNAVNLAYDEQLVASSDIVSNLQIVSQSNKAQIQDQVLSAILGADTDNFAQREIIKNTTYTSNSSNLPTLDDFIESLNMTNFKKHILFIGFVAKTGQNMDFSISPTIANSMNGALKIYIECCMTIPEDCYDGKKTPINNCLKQIKECLATHISDGEKTTKGIKEMHAKLVDFIERYTQNKRQK